MWFWFVRVQMENLNGKGCRILLIYYHLNSQIYKLKVSELKSYFELKHYNFRDILKNFEF